MEPFFGYYPIDLGPAKFELFSNNDCPRVLNFRAHGGFETYSLKLWCALVPQATVIVDIGAQVGIVRRQRL